MTVQTNLLKGERVYLDALKKNDLQQLTIWFNDHDLMRVTRGGLNQPITPEAKEAWYTAQQANDRVIQFAIRTVADDTLIGYVSAFQINWQARRCTLAILIGEHAYLGKGYGTDTLHLFMRYAFMEMNLYRIELMVNSYNLRAIKSYEKVGFVHEGVLRETAWRDGQYYDTVCMGILREEWEKTIA